MEELKKLTKDELIWLIERIKEHSLIRIPIEYALADLQAKRRKDVIDQMDEAAKKMSACMQRYIDLMEPYKGKRFSDIPLSVLEKMRAAIEEREAAEKEYNRLQRAFDRMC